MGPQPTIAERAEQRGVKNVQSIPKFSVMLNGAKQLGRPIHFLPLYRSENKIILHGLIGMAPKDVAKRYSVELVKAVVGQREFKTTEELIEIENAVDVSVDMHVAGMRFAKPEMMEAQVTAEIHKIAIAAGGNISFPIIATKNGQTLHNHYHGNVIKEGDLSSTIPISKNFTSEQKEIYQITLDAHNAAIDVLWLGEPFKNANIAAGTTIFEGLK